MGAVVCLMEGGGGAYLLHIFCQGRVLAGLREHDSEGKVFALVLCDLAGLVDLFPCRDVYVCVYVCMYVCVCVCVCACVCVCGYVCIYIRVTS